MGKLLIILLLVLICNSDNFGQCSSSVSPLTQSVNCTAPNVSFTATAITPTSNVRHDWYSPYNPLPSGVPVFSSTNAVSVLSGSYSAGIYTVVTTDLGNLCQVSNTFEITSPSSTPFFTTCVSPSFSLGCTPSVTLGFCYIISTQTPPATCSFTFLPPTYTGVITPSVVLGNGTSTVANIGGTWTMVAQDNSNFCRAFLPVPIGISSVQPSFSHTVGGAGLVFFQSTSTGTNGGTTFIWDFGDGNTGTGISTSHTYSNGGVHQVILSTNNPNCNTASNPVNVNTLPCTANSGFSLAYTGTPQVWNAAPNYFGNVTNVLWSWGDGNFDNTMFPTHTYSAAGFYNICLSVTVSCASSSSFCSNYNIYRSAEVTEEMTMVTVNVIPKLTTGISSNAEIQGEVLVYPNPSTSEVYVRIPENKSGRLRVFGVSGNLLRSLPISNQVTELDPLIPGIYFVEISIDGVGIRKKIVIMNKQ